MAKNSRAKTDPESNFHFAVSASSLNKLAEVIWVNAKDKGFKDKKTPVSELCSNLHGEVSELWEAYRSKSLNKPCDKAEKMAAVGLTVLTCAEEELADIIIRALDSSAELKIDIGRAVAVKHAFNRTRPRRHGGKIA
jgi:NTP pyrophosphatase (non-canonical NTP hydrolase)